MDEQETWSLGSALAIIERGADRLRVRLQGWATTMAYEALHMRLAGETARQRELVLDHDVHLLMTSLSAAEAATRGLPASARATDVITLVCVPSTRLVWAQAHCQAMAGLRYLPQVLPRLEVAADWRSTGGPWS